MTDFFALLEEPWRPWIDPDALKEKFLAQSSAVHPDRTHSAGEADRETANARYATLNTAYQRLRDPKQRLAHLLELERGSRPREVQDIPPAMVDFFLEISRVCREVDRFLQERDRIESPLLKVQAFERAMDWADQFSVLQRTVRERIELLESELRQLNARWETAPPIGDPERILVLPLDRVEELYRLAGYLNRWLQQLGERFARLAM